MKRWIILLLCLVLLTGCAGGEDTSEEILFTEAPMLTLTWEDGQLEVWSGGYSWVYPGEDGQMVSALACGMSPMAAAERYTAQTGTEQTQFKLSCAVLPDDITIYRWNLETGQREKWFAGSGDEAFALDAGYGYELDAVWPESWCDVGYTNFWGSGEYSFRVE